MRKKIISNVLSVRLSLIKYLIWMNILHQFMKGKTIQMWQMWSLFWFEIWFEFAYCISSWRKETIQMWNMWFWAVFKIVYREVHVPKSLISKIFEPFLKSCTSEVHVPRGRVPRGLTVFHIIQRQMGVSFYQGFIKS